MLALVFVLGYSTTYAQDENNPWQIDLGINAVDFYPTGEDRPLGSFPNEYFNAEDHWNILPSISTINVSKYLGDNFSIGIGGSINKITKFGEMEVDDLSYYAVDGIVKYNISELVNLGKLQPYLGIGGGYTWVDDIGAGTVNGSLGLNYMFTDHLGISVQSTYKHAFEDYLNTHLQHSVGLSFRLGGTDTDGDGIYDKKDVCPEIPGLEQFNGCPDTDGDGIEDSKDTCPEVTGLAEYNGCPDTDGDGISDDKDKCPKVAGLAALAGCPDADEDGIADGDDKCPNEAGPIANNGCPWPDTDGDGVVDKDDECPDVAGTIANNGCKDVLKGQAAIDALAKTIYFDYKSSSLKSESYPVLDKIVSVLKDFNDYQVIIDGYTDNIGSKSFNQTLSEARAAIVSDYLSNKGVDSNALTSNGHGEENPAASNKTEEGRSQNRRSEIAITIEIK